MKYPGILSTLGLILLLACAGCSGPSVFTPGTTPQQPTNVVSTTHLPTTTLTTSVPTPTPDPYPHALSLKEVFPFGSGKVASEAAVYRYWINSTYQWHSDIDNRYYPETPTQGYKYLLVFVHMVNNGTTRVWYPPATDIAVHYEGSTYWPDPKHYLPDKASNVKDTPVEIQEIQYYQKLNGDEYVEDFGFSHGTTSDFLYPGSSNALDGYIIYMVPETLSAGETYVDIPFNGQDRGIWKLA
jgi:hypothetical protein